MTVSHPISVKSRISRPRGDGPDPVDIHVGHRIKLRRTLLHISQEQLAAYTGVTFQQIQKYESGSNRVSASRLYHISRALNCAVSYFFEDIGTDLSDARFPSSAATSQQDPESIDADPMQRTETLELVHAYWRLQNAELRKVLLELLSNISRRE